MSIRKNRLIMFTRVYPPNKGGIEVVAELYTKYFMMNNYEVQVVSMLPNAKKKINKTKGKFNESITFIQPTICIQSVFISINYIFYCFLNYITSKKEEIFLIHHPSPLDSFLISIFYFLKKRNYIIIFHANIHSKNYFLTKISQFFCKLALKNSKTVIFTSENLLKLNSNKFSVDKKSFFLPIENSVKTEINYFTKENNSVFRILFIGRLVKYKGLEILLKAIEHIDNIHLEIFGDGVLKNELIKLTKQISIENKVTFHKDLSETNKIRLLETCNCLVLPSINEAEAFGIVQLEAMAYALPVINTNLPTGVPEVSLHLKSGLTVPPQNIDSLKEAILLLSRDTQLLDNLSKGAIEQAKKFNFKNIFSKFNEILFKIEKNI